MTENDLPIASSLTAEVDRVHKLLDSLEGEVDRAGNRWEPLLRKSDKTMLPHAADESGSDLTRRVRYLGDRLADLTTRLECLTDSVDL